jgi:hypothetical protein
MQKKEYLLELDSWNSDLRRKWLNEVVLGCDWAWITEHAFFISTGYIQLYNLWTNRTICSCFHTRVVGSGGFGSRHESTSIGNQKNCRYLCSCACHLWTCCRLLRFISYCEYERSMCKSQKDSDAWWKIPMLLTSYIRTALGFGFSVFYSYLKELYNSGCQSCDEEFLMEPEKWKLLRQPWWYLNCFGPLDFRPSEIKIFGSQENTFNLQKLVPRLEREGIYLSI